MTDTPNAAPTVAPSFTPDEQFAALVAVFGEKYAKDFIDPVVFLPYSFSSPTVKQFYKREFPLISRTLMVESVYRRRPAYNQAVLDDFALMVARKLADIMTLLSTHCDRLRIICKTNSVDVNATYLHPDNRVVPIIASHSKTYLSVLYKLDELYHLTGSANLNGVIDGSSRSKMELLCRKAVRAFSAMLRNEIVKLRKESQRMWAAMGNVVDEELARAENAHGEGVEEFDKSMSDDAALDPAAHVDPESASQVIDDIASSAAAARPRRKKADAPTTVTPADPPATPAAPATVDASTASATA